MEKSREEIEREIIKVWMGINKLRGKIEGLTAYMNMLIDELDKREEVLMKDEFPQRCTYCWKDWEPKQLRPLPVNLKVDPRNKYCPKCYPEVLAEMRNLPWNRTQY